VKNSTYFISDIHLGAPTVAQSQVRERKLVGFLKSIAEECERLFIVGDLFDYWFEYKHVVPRGHTRLLGQLGQMVDNGLELHIFVGNHDLWMRDYLSEELGAIIHHQPLVWRPDGSQKAFYIAHGDGLGPGDLKYKALKKLFTNPLALWAYKRLHPNFGVGFAAKMSRLSRNSQDEEDHAFLGEKERQLLWSKSILKKQWFDYFIYGHRHHKVELTLEEKPEESGTKIESKYIVLGDWITLNSYAKWDGQRLTLNTYQIHEN
jgi:UDP-2,3-diacylglucosamine hydrolase